MQKEKPFYVEIAQIRNTDINLNTQRNLPKTKREENSLIDKRV